MPDLVRFDGLKAALSRALHALCSVRLDKMATCVGLLVVSTALFACGSETTHQQAFCEQAVPLLQGEIGAEPAPLREQMEKLALAAERLPDEQRQYLMSLIDDLVAQLRLAEQGDFGTDGYSSMDVVEYVSPLCGRDDLIGWMVMPLAGDTLALSVRYPLQRPATRLGMTQLQE